MPTLGVRRSVLVRFVVLAGAALLLCAAPATEGAAPAHAAHPHWKVLSPSSAPYARNWAGMAYDANDHEVVLYGGYNANVGLFSDTWTYVAGTWTQIYPAHHPTGTSGLLLAYDPALKGVLAFGGQAAYGTAYYNDTWLFQKGNWTQLSPTVSPSARSQYMMAWDPAINEMVLFGGYPGSYPDLADTWVFNGTTWTQVHPHTSPDGRQWGTLVYDAANKDLLLVGGDNATVGAMPGTWAFTGTDWKWMKSASQINPVEFLMSADTPAGVPILFGGQTPYVTTQWNTTYELVNGGWHLLKTKSAPSPRDNAAFAYDGHDGYFLLFGGATAPGYYIGDTWELT